MKNWAIVDIESQGASTSYASIISIAGILVSPELQELTSPPCQSLSVFGSDWFRLRPNN